MDHKLVEKKTLFGLLNEEDKDNEAPSFHHLAHKNIPSSYIHSSIIPSPESSPLFCRSSESMWTRSPPPPPRTPSTPLLYQCISSLRHQGNIYSITLSKGLVFIGSNTSHIRAWQLLDCSEKGYIHTNSSKIQALLAYEDMLFSSHKDHKIRIWSLRNCSTKFNPRKITTIPKSSSLNPLKLLFSRRPNKPRQHKDTISCMAYNHDDGLLYTGSWDKTVKAWRVSDGKCVDSFVAHANNINDMVIDRDGFLVTCSSDGTIKMWSRVCGETFHTLTMTLSLYAFPIYALALSEEMSSNNKASTLLYSGSSDGCINYWGQHNSDWYTHCGSIQAHQFAVLRVVTLENLVISGSEDAMIKIWRRGGGEGKVNYECIAVLEGHKGPVKSLASCLEKDVNGSGFFVFSAGSDQTFKIWRVKCLPEIVSFQDIINKRKSSFDHQADNNHGDDDDDDDDDDVGGDDEKFTRFVSTPTLSPTWVVRKLKSRNNSSIDA